MKTILFITTIFLFAELVLAQNNCFEDCWQNYEKSTLAFPKRNDTIMQGLIGCKFPDFSAKSLEGKLISLGQLSGKVIVINFYSVYCPPCVAEIPALNKLADEYKDKEVVFIAFSRDTPSDAVNFVKQTDFKYNVLINIPNLESTFCMIGGWPMNMVIDKNGFLRQLFCGGTIDESAKINAYNKMKPVIDKYLN